VLERSYNKYRTGADIAETVLTPAKVKSTASLLHKQFEMKVDGNEGSPLYASAVAMRPPTYLRILRALLRASNDVVSATWRNRANLPVAASSSAPCKLAPRPHLGATLSRCASGQPACAAHRATATTASDQAKLVTGSR
jgi:hypothetical protein